MKKARTILAVLLAVIMVLSVLPAAFAENAKGSKKFDRIDRTAAEQTERRVSKLDKSAKTRGNKPLTSMEIDPDTIVTAIVIFEDPALSDTYTAEEIRAKKAETAQNRLSDAHDTFFKSLSFEAKRMYDYTALINGMSLKTAYKNLSVMEKMSGVKRVFIANEFSAPVVQQPNQMNANLITGAAMMQNVRYNGEGMVVAILDTGLNYAHEAFQDYGLITEPTLTEESVAAVQTTVEGKYLSEKVPFSYDYHDSDDDVNDGNGHGTHVSGTVTGYVAEPDGAVTFSGAAPAAQLVFMKIFADDTTKDSGTNSGIYMAALEDAFLLGVDAINMSIGAPGGFTYDDELEGVFGNVYKKLDQAGIIVCISAGNEYSMAHSPANWAGEGYVLAEYADYGEVASPSTYEGNLSVASMENFAYPSYAMIYNGNNVMFTDACEDGEHGWLQNFSGKTLEMVNCGQGHVDEIPAEVEGKVALIQRGDITFSEKVENAAAKGAIGVIVYNSKVENMRMSIDPYYVPAVLISKADGEAILEGLDADNTIEVLDHMIEVDNENAWLMSDFSSWGCTPNLELKPSITAPGGMIYSAVAGAPDAYEVYSGTSMASPNACGSFLLLSQYLKETYPTLSKAQRAELAEDLVQSTAWVPYDAADYLYSPRKSGAGILDLEAAISSPVYFIEPVNNLYDDPEKEGVFKFRYTAVNLSDTDQTYDLTAVGMYDYPVKGYDNYYNTLTSDYLLDGNGMTVEGETTITVPAHGTYDGKLTFTLDDDVKEYFDGVYTNGNFFEGYVEFAPDETNTGNAIPTVQGVLGDVNGDGKVTAADAAEILRAVVGLTELDEMQALLADVNLDGNVTAADASFILRCVVGLDQLPALVLPEEADAPFIHLTFMGFYGDWKQGPVLDSVWTTDQEYMFYYALLSIQYPEYIANGYLPTNAAFQLMQTNVAVTEINNMFINGNSLYINYGTDQNPLYTYTGYNPMTFMAYTDYMYQIFGDGIDDIYLNAWYDVAMNYNPLHNAISSYYYGEHENIDGFVAFPIQLRNARHLIMTISDAETGEIYFQQDDEYIGKAYLSNGKWGSRDYYLWYGVNENEESENYGNFVDSGTVVNVTFEAQLDYKDADLVTEREFQMIVDYDSPFITDTELDSDTKVLTVSFADNESGVAFADAYYVDEEGNPVALGYGIGEEAESFEIDLSELPEDVELIYLDAMDYASNWPEFVLEATTGKQIYTPAYAAELALNDEESLGTTLPVLGYVSDNFNGSVYLAEELPEKGYPFGIEVKFADDADLEGIYPGSQYLIVGELDNYYGCPRLDNAYIAYVADPFEDDDVYYTDFFDYCIYYPMMFEAYGLSEEVTFDDLFDDPGMYVGGVRYFEDLEVIGVTECGDGTRTISLTNGTNCVDVVGCEVGENVTVGDTLYYGYFVMTMDHGTFQFHPLQGGNYEYLVFNSDMVEE